MEGYQLKRGGVFDHISFNPMTMREMHKYFKGLSPENEKCHCRARRELLKIS